ncbi:MAG: 4Fe-4S dicluster domain-containing protein [Deltaproteobacteria bacterium]|nr:4Fe-4S dicluster domain-containing protein [Deltaproteobacteria bacterium]MBW2641056.1 4Fe-4S dicluster domain-containing protein [Deltaproteobacteria bacterium]MBW2681679.1 4Fe-4S dicluster domain-containing protein [Deltaproteobacteria bacterium]
MAHHTTKSGYVQLVDRLNRFPQGAPPSKLLYKILEMLFSEKEAKLVSLLPLRPFSAEKAAYVWKMDRVRTRKILDQLCGRAILLDIQQKGRQVYCLPPPMAGFFEFSLMRIRGDINQKILSELYYQYLNVEEDFVKNLFLTGETKLGRVFVHEPVLSSENALQILDYERATQVIKTASHIGISTCYCRHKMSHMGLDCDAPKEICMTFNSVASSLIKYDYARRVEVSECLELLETAYSHNLVQFGDNVREDVSFICNCCGCCCDAMTTARKFAFLQPVHTTNFIPKIQDEACTGCIKCVTVCPVEAMSLVSANDPHHPKKKKARVNEKICLGCGICARVCPENCICLESRDQRVITPLNTAHRVVVMAIEQGKLQELIFDNQALESHRAMAAVLGVILKLPLVKQAMASQQMKSICLEALVSRLNL